MFRFGTREQRRSGRKQEVCDTVDEVGLDDRVDVGFGEIASVLQVSDRHDYARLASASSKS